MFHPTCGNNFKTLKRLSVHTSLKLNSIAIRSTFIKSEGFKTKLTAERVGRFIQRSIQYAYIYFSKSKN